MRDTEATYLDKLRFMRQIRAYHGLPVSKLDSTLAPKIGSEAVLSPRAGSEAALSPKKED